MVSKLFSFARERKTCRFCYDQILFSLCYVIISIGYYLILAQLGLLEWVCEGILVYIFLNNFFCVLVERGYRPRLLIFLMQRLVP